MRENDRMIVGADIGGAKRAAQIKLQEMRQKSVLGSSPQSDRTAAESQSIGFTDRDRDPSPSTDSDWSREPSDSGSAWERIRRGAGYPASGKNERRRTTSGRGTGGVAAAAGAAKRP